MVLPDGFSFFFVGFCGFAFVVEEFTAVLRKCLASLNSWVCSPGVCIKLHTALLRSVSWQGFPLGRAIREFRCGQVGEHKRGDQVPAPFSGVEGSIGEEASFPGGASLCGIDSDPHQFP